MYKKKQQKPAARTRHVEHDEDEDVKPETENKGAREALKEAIKEHHGWRCVWCGMPDNEAKANQCSRCGQAR